MESNLGKVTYGAAAEEEKDKGSRSRAASKKDLAEKLSELPEKRLLQRVSQPPTVTGGQLRPYQLDALNWLIQLFENGMNGILADQMGLGKTITTISLLAHLWYMGIHGPFLVVAPVSTLSNWMNEFAKWTPTIPAVMYHGTKEERTALRQRIFAMEGRKAPASKRQRVSASGASNGTGTGAVVVTSYEIAIKDNRFLMSHKWKYLVVDEAHRLKNFECKLICQLRQLHTESRLLLTGTPLQNSLTELWSLLNFLLPELFSDLASFKRWFDFTSVLEANGGANVGEALHSELVEKLHKVLKPFLLRRLKQDVEASLPKKAEVVLYASQTPAQLAFYNAVKNRTFVCQGFSYNNLLMQLRKICNHPFLFPQEAIRKVFSEADDENPSRGASPLLGLTPAISPGYPTKDEAAAAAAEPAEGDTVTMTGMHLRHVKPQNYSDDLVVEEEEEGDDGDDVAVIPTIAKPASSTKPKAPRSAFNVFMAERWAAYHLENAEDKNCAGSSKNNVNPVTMAQLNSVFSREWRELPPEEKQRYQEKFLEEQRACEALLWEESGAAVEPITVDRLVAASGKMQLVNQLLPVLKSQGHKVLMFSQMTKMLDLLETYVTLMGYRYSRIDGSMTQPERQHQIEAFNTDPDVFLFLLSTRAGGQGINLSSADTVIIYDSDWNPQMDIQAQDRCHRIGQTKPVVVFRLITANSVDSRILKRARSKLFLERLVVGKGTFSRRTNTRLTANDIRDLLSMNNKGEERPITEAEIAKVLDRDYVISQHASATASASSLDAVQPADATAASTDAAAPASAADGSQTMKMEDQDTKEIDTGFEYVPDSKVTF